MAHNLHDLLFALEFPLTGNPDDDARALRVAALLPGFSRKSYEGEWGQARMSLADAGAYRPEQSAREKRGDRPARISKG